MIYPRWTQNDGFAPSTCPSCGGNLVVKKYAVFHDQLAWCCLISPPDRCSNFFFWPLSPDCAAEWLLAQMES